MYKKEFNLKISEVSLRIDPVTEIKRVDVTLRVLDPLEDASEHTAIGNSFGSLRFSYEMPDGSTKKAETFAAEQLAVQEGIIVV